MVLQIYGSIYITHSYLPQRTEMNNEFQMDQGNSPDESILWSESPISGLDSYQNADEFVIGEQETIKFDRLIDKLSKKENLLASYHAFNVRR
jgi:hypothetical protein